MDRFLQNNTLAKGVAILIAVMLWMIVSLDDQASPSVRQSVGSSTIDNVKLEVIYDDEIYAIKEIEDTVKVTLTGRRSLLNINTFRTNHRVYVDLSSLTEGSHQVKVLHEGFPSELQVDIIPAWVNVVLERKETRAFPVKIELTGTAREGFTVDAPIVEQEEVHVSAPPSILDNIATVRGFINIDKEDSTVTQDVALKVYDHQGNELPAEVSPSSIKVEVPIHSPSSVVPWQLNLVNQLPEGISLIDVQSNISELRVYAPLQELEALQKVEYDLDLSRVESSETLQVEIPVQRKWYNTYPRQAEVEIKVGPTQERVFANVPITVTGLQEGYQLEFVDLPNGTIEIPVQGSREKLNQLRAEDIKASIQVQQLQAGEHTLPLQVEVEGNAIFYRLPELNVRVYISEEALETTGEMNEEEGP